MKLIILFLIVNPKSVALTRAALFTDVITYFNKKMCALAEFTSYRPILRGGMPSGYQSI